MKLTTPKRVVNVLLKVFSVSLYMEKKTQTLQHLEVIMTNIKKRSAELLKQAKTDGTLHYYFDPVRCNIGQLVKLENGKETIINKYE